jgi:hypothetical protein
MRRTNHAPGCLIGIDVLHTQVRFHPARPVHSKPPGPAPTHHPGALVFIGRIVPLRPVLIMPFYR